MKSRAGRIALMITTLSLALPVSAWAGSAQASLAIGVVVPARCAVQVPGSLAATRLAGAAGVQPVTMRCTKGTLPSTAGPASSTAVAPQISRHFVETAVSAMSTSSGPLAEISSTASEASAAHVVITVNF